MSPLDRSLIRRKASIEDVAQRAKVSISTVSRVINKLPTVSKKNQARVEEAIAALKYNPNVSAQRLARGFNNAIGLVIPGYPGIFHSFYAIEIIRGIGHACETLRMDLVFHISDGSKPINVNAVGGVIYADIIENRKQVESTIDLGIPCIIINNIVEDMNVSFIGVDNVLGGRIATEHLINLNHRKIAMVTGNLKTQAGMQRLQGFKEAIIKSDISIGDDYIVEGDYSRRSARLAAEKFLKLKEPPTAIFASSDEMALEIISVIIENGMKVPDDISVIGFDDNPQAIYGPVSLTTVNQPLFHMAEQSVKYLNAIIYEKKRAPLKKVLIPELIIRESCSSRK